MSTETAIRDAFTYECLNGDILNVMIKLDEIAKATSEIAKANGRIADALLVVADAIRTGKE